MSQRRMRPTVGVHECIGGFPRYHPGALSARLEPTGGPGTSGMCVCTHQCLWASRLCQHPRAMVCVWLCACPQATEAPCLGRRLSVPSDIDEHAWLSVCTRGHSCSGGPQRCCFQGLASTTLVPSLSWTLEKALGLGSARPAGGMGRAASPPLPWSHPPPLHPGVVALPPAVEGGPGLRSAPSSKTPAPWTWMWLQESHGVWGAIGSHVARPISPQQPGPSSWGNC